MHNLQIVKAVTKQDCLVCNKFLIKLMQFESKIDSSIFDKTSTEEVYEKVLQQNNVFVAYAKYDTPVGYISGYLKNLKGQGVTTNRVFVDSLYVDENFRGRGIGKKLLQEFENWAIERFGDDYEIELLCLSNNKQALDFYNSLGYFEVKKTLRKTINKK